MSRPRRLHWPIRFAALLWFAGAGLFPALAQEEKPLDDNVIDLTADGSIEWLRDENKFIAEGNAKVTRNDVTYRSDRLIAHFRDKSGGGSEVWRVEFHGNIQVDFSGGTLTADDAAYEMESEVFIATGRDLRMVNKDTTMTAKDSIEYWDAKNMTVARGNAMIVKKERTLRGDIVVAYGTEDEEPATGAAKPEAGTKPKASAQPKNGTTAGADEDSDIDRIEVFGNVLVTSKKQVIRADKAIYEPDTELARLQGSVKITSGESQFNGEFAVFDFKSETGKMTGSGSTRAHGLFKSKEAPPQARQQPAGQDAGTVVGGQKPKRKN